MSLRTTITGATWTQVGTGPATVQVLSDGVSVMVACETAQPATNSDGLVLIGGAANLGASHTFQGANAIWAQVVNAAATAIVAVQPE